MLQRVQVRKRKSGEDNRVEMRKSPICIESVFYSGQGMFKPPSLKKSLKHLLLYLNGVFFFFSKW